MGPITSRHMYAFGPIPGVLQHDSECKVKSVGHVEDNAIYKGFYV